MPKKPIAFLFGIAALVTLGLGFLSGDISGQRWAIAAVLTITGLVFALSKSEGDFDIGVVTHGRV